MSNYGNSYISHIENYVTKNTPLNFMLDNKKCEKINEELSGFDIDINEKDLVVASYTLIHATFNYHLAIADNPTHKPYYILVGDYISSYVSEILFEHKLHEMMKIFIINTKKIAINNISLKHEDTLLTDIINYYKGR